MTESSCTVIDARTAFARNPVVAPAKPATTQKTHQGSNGETGQNTVPPTDVPVLRRAAMDCLARREHSYYELTQKLLENFPDAGSELIDAVMSQLRTETLQSDERFTDDYVRYRKSKGFAYLHIKSDLVQRRVPMPIINAYLYEDDADWIEIAQRLLNKRLRDDDKLVFGSKEHRRLVRFLQARGFSQLDTRRILAAKLQPA